MFLARGVLAAGVGVLALTATQPDPGALGPCSAAPAAQVLPPAGPQAEEDSDTDDLTVASLNLAGRPELAEVLAVWVRERGADVVLLQETGGDDRDGAAFAADAGRRLGYASAYVPARDVEPGRSQGLAILSRYPLERVRARALAYNQLRFRSRCRVVMAATVDTPEGRVQVVNVHFDTRINAERRLAQVEQSLQMLDGPSRLRIVGGDFNTVNVKWWNSMWPLPFAQRQVDAVLERMTEAGFHTPFVRTRPTLQVLFLGLKLDWVYLSQELIVQDAGVDDLPFTDHRGVWTRVASKAESAGGG
jgi:endonuclease/exonuclease/phosphatase family metal-dependent hydrolase